MYDYLINERSINLFLEINEDYPSNVYRRIPLSYSHIFHILGLLEDAELITSGSDGRKHIFKHTRKGKQVAEILNNLKGDMIWTEG